MRNTIRQRIVYFSVVVVLFGVIFTAWNISSNGKDPVGTELAGAQKYRDVPIVVYLVDTLRADRLGVYGYSAAKAPQIDALAADSVVFEQAYAPAPWTLPSVASLFTSTFICEHRIIKDDGKLSDSLETLAEKLQRSGYRTGGFYRNPWIGSPTGLNRGFDVYGYIPPEDQDQVPQAIRGFLHRAGDKPPFLYLHTMEPHDTHKTPWRFIDDLGTVGAFQKEDYKNLILRYTRLTQVDWKNDVPIGTTDNTAEIDEVTASLGDMLESIDLLYDASVRWADANLAEAITALKISGVWDDAIFIFLSDHGEEMGEHGGWFHGQSIYEELAHVPLIIHFPGGEYGGQRISRPVSLVDIVPTILDFAGRSGLCDSCRGNSLLPLLNGDDDPGDLTVPVPAMRLNHGFYYRPFKEHRGDQNVVIRREQWKGIWNAELETLELYDLVADPGELSDLNAGNPELVQDMSEYARGWLENCQVNAVEPEQADEMDEETRERLRALGYLD
jgi:arylsulfatase A-like enzyme